VTNRGKQHYIYSESVWLETRLNEENEIVNLSGLASKCDLTLYAVPRRPEMTEILRCEGQPKTIFITMRNPFFTIPYFLERILPTLDSPFAVVFSGGDKTFPRQCDLRWPAYSEGLQRGIFNLLGNPNFVRGFVENLSEHHSKLEPIPLGLVFITNAMRYAYKQKPVRPSKNRERSVLCLNRIRNGAQWETRRYVHHLAIEAWHEFCDVRNNEVPELDFDSLLQKYSFVLCPSGGGYDPSPKAWRAIINGTIPIIKRMDATLCYEGLPVLFIDEWTQDALSPEILKRARDSLLIEGVKFKEEEKVYEKLKLSFWWDKVLQAIKV
jgi:hypothetical protein